VTWERDAYCGECGAKLEESDAFCPECGAPVPGIKTAPTSDTPKRRGRRPKAAGSAESTAIMGFVYKGVSVAADEEQVLFGSTGYGISLLDRELNYEKQGVYGGSVCLREDGAAALDYGTLRVLNKKLGIVSDIPLLDDCEEKLASYVLTPRYALYCYIPEDDRIAFLRYDLDSGERSERTLNAAAFGTRKLYDHLGRCRMYGSTVYLDIYGEYPDEDGDLRRNELTAAVDTDSWTVTVLWNDREDSAKPMFYDFERGVMWTQPREGEMKRRGWQQGYNEELGTSTVPLVARRIGSKQPILPTYPVWQGMPCNERYYYYFDGKRAYYAPDYWHFYAIAQDGSNSQDWCDSSHGRTEETVVWKDMVIADLRADYEYTVYPASFERQEGIKTL
jgi:hypothetical protein